MQGFTRVWVGWAAMALGCTSKGVAHESRAETVQVQVQVQAPATRDPAAPRSPTVKDWRRLLPEGARTEAQVDADLDGDGRPELVVLSSRADPDYAGTEGITPEQVRMNLQLLIQVFGRKAEGFVELGRIEMTGGVQPLEVTRLAGGGARRFVVASALHCGGSCAGIELHVAGVERGRFQHLLDLDSVDHGEWAVTGEGALEVAEATYGTEDHAAPTGRRVVRYQVSGGVLVVAR